MALKQKLQGRTLDLNKSEKSYKQTFYGTQQEVDTFINGLTLGTFSNGKGYLSAISKRQENAAIWQVEVTYTVNYDDNSFDNTAATVVGKKSAQLTVRNIPMPLEKHPNYRTIWNHYLVSNNQTSMIDTYDKTDTILTQQQRQHYMWVKDLSEIPTQPDANGNYWIVSIPPSKPGVQFFDYSCFVVQEMAKYGSATAAGNAISKRINHIVSPSNTFGLSGGNWKLDQANVQYDGKNWIATTVYTKSGDSAGWDTDLYGDSTSSSSSH